MVTHFDNGFEEGDFSSWTASGTGSGGTAEVNTDRPHDGTYGAHLIKGYCYYDFGSQSEVYARCYVQFDAVDLADGEKCEIIGFQVNTSTGVMGVKIRNISGTMYWQMAYRNSGGWNGDNQTSPAIVADQWYCVEIYVKIHDSAGEARVYIDGVETHTQTGLNNSDRTPEEVNLGHDTNLVKDTYFDCVKAADAYIGTEGVDHTKDLSETMNITDTITKDITKVLAETLNITDVVAKDFIKVLTESMTITDSVVASILYILNLTETLTITDSVHKILFDLDTFDPVTVLTIILYSNWNETTVTRPSIRSVVLRDAEQGLIKRWNHIRQGDLIRVYEKKFDQIPMSAGYDYTTTKIHLKVDITTVKGRSHMFDLFDEVRRVLHLKRGEPTTAYTSWRPLQIVERQFNYDKLKKIWRMTIGLELVEKCAAVA